MSASDDYEKLGVFYLGRTGRPNDKAGTRQLLLYDSSDLTTHAVCVGMTGSGKTGLCIGLLEEALIDGIPALVIDPKGDLTNLLLTFPQLRPEDFAPWVPADEAKRAGVAPEAYAKQVAETWKEGLAEWDQDGARIQRLRDAAEFTVYTPGGTAGTPISILRSFTPPPEEVSSDPELLRQRVATTVSSLLALVGIEADPVKSREHVLLSALFSKAWAEGQELDLQKLIEQVQTPPIAKLGVLDLETFYPAKDRFALVMALNNLVASPGFAAWSEGAPLDVGALLHGPKGRPRVAILSIAHLGDAERMFFVSLLLNEVVGWMRTQPGTSSLRAVLYMDELAGFLPPVAQPPSKQPLLTLLKQARAFGVGVVLATQNPVDLDYKALSNAGTWFIGRLQTERDKARVLDGLEGASTAAGSAFNRSSIDKLLSGLEKRVFLLNNVHDKAPVLFQTRWTLSYLRGPLNRDELRRLSSSQAEPTAAAGGASDVRPVAGKAASGTARRPTLAPDVSQFFIPEVGAPATGQTLFLEPRLLGASRISFTDAKLGINFTSDDVFLAPFSDGAVAVDWANAERMEFTVGDLVKDAPEGAQYGAVATAAAQGKSYEAWTKTFLQWVMGNRTLELWKSPSQGILSAPLETEKDFRARLQLKAREARDAASDTLKQKYAAQYDRLTRALQTAEQRVERQKAEATQAKIQTGVSLATTLLGAFLGRKAVSASTLGKATTTARSASRAMKQSQDVELANASVEQVQQRIAELDTKFQEELDEAQANANPASEPLEAVVLRPTRTRVSVQLVALAWLPYWKDAGGALTPAWT
jgi:hypothetical protein